MNPHSKKTESYRLYKEENEGFIFHTDAGSEYLIYNELAYYYMPDKSFSHLLRFFGFTRKHGKHAGKDPRIAETVGKKLRDFLDEGFIILYVCEQSDGKQKGRHLMFNDWIDQNLEAFIKLDYQVDDTLFASMIYLENHPFRSDIESSLEMLNGSLGKE